MRLPWKFRLALFVFFLSILAGCGVTDIDAPGEQVAQCPGDTNWSFVVIGDTRSNPGIFGIHVENILGISPAPALILHTGDLISGQSPDLEWSTFHSVMAPLSRIPFYAAVGNHDVMGSSNSGEVFKKETKDKSDLFQAVHYDDTLFLILNTQDADYPNRIDGPQLEWLKGQLENTTARRIVAMTHVPFFPQGHDIGKGVKNAADIHNLFLQYGVTLVFSGHEHQFFHNDFDGITYVITGGGGAPLYHENGGDFYHFVLGCSCEDKIVLKVVALDGSVWDTYNVPLK